MDQEKINKLCQQLVGKDNKEDIEATYSGVLPDHSADVEEKIAQLPVYTIDESHLQNFVETMPGENKSVATDNTVAQTTNYEIGNEIARGGMGIVYKAVHKSLQRNIAVKMISQKSDPNARQKFIEESMVAAFLDHPNIVPIYELGQNEKGEILLAMKLVGGTSWKSLLHPETEGEKTKASEYDLEAHLRILLNVINAIAFAHNKGFIHNDLKPSNVMVGEFGEILVTDWGTAAAIDDQKNQTIRAIHCSEVTAPMGTPCYMPPELVEGRGNDIGPWTDVYLLGGILYEIIMKKPPHSSKTVIGALASSLRGNLPAFDKKVPQGLQEICHKALSKECAERYQNVEELKIAISEFLKHRESIAIADKAEQIFQQARQKDSIDLSAQQMMHIYDQLAQSIAGFEQALELWSENTSATKRREKARLTYAEIALEHGDIGLAETQIMKMGNEAPELQKCIQKAKNKKDYAQRMAKRLRWGLIIATVMILVVMTVGLILVQQEQQRTKDKNTELLKEQEKVLKERKRTEAKNTALLKEREKVRLSRQKSFAVTTQILNLIHKQQINLRDFDVVPLLENMLTEVEGSDLKSCADIMDMIGSMYYYKKSNYDKAAEWYTKAAKYGSASGMYDLGYMYEYGEGVKKDIAVANKWYKSALAKKDDVKDARTIDKIGNAYYHGRGTKVDYQEAKKWYLRGTALGYGRSMRNVGKLYHYGLSVEKNAKEAEKWYRKAINLGDGVAPGLIKKLGVLYEIMIFTKSKTIDKTSPHIVHSNWTFWQDGVDSAVDWGNGKAYFFKGAEYIRYDLKSYKVDEGYPTTIDGQWGTLWKEGIDAAVNWNNGKVYFFKGAEYIRYDIKADTYSAPMSIKKFWPYLWPEGIDAAVNLGNGKAYFFKGDQYISYDIENNRIEKGYPKKARWEFTLAALNFGKDTYYIFTK